MGLCSGLVVVVLLADGFDVERDSAFKSDGIWPATDARFFRKFNSFNKFKLFRKDFKLKMICN